MKIIASSTELELVASLFLSLSKTKTDDVYEILFSQSMPQNSLLTPPGLLSSKTKNKEIKTENIIAKRQNKTNLPAEKTGLPNNKISTLFRIESFDADCVKDQRTAAFAILEVNNTFSLYYRDQICDVSVDSSFRKYLLSKDGNLVAYYYIRNLQNLREHMTDHKLPLRHNGNTGLKQDTIENLLQTFSDLRFL